MAKNLDELIKESDEALKRIETLEARRGSSSSGKGFLERVLRHSKQHSNHLVPIALAGGLVGLSLVRYHEKYSHKECIQGLEEKIRLLERDVEALRERGSRLSQAVCDGLNSDRPSWWKPSSLARLELEKALDMYHGRTRESQDTEPCKMNSVPSPETTPRPFI